MHYEYSDSIAGYVKSFDRDSKKVVIATNCGECEAKLTHNTFARMVRNLGEPYYDCTEQLDDMLTEGRFLFAYGVFYPQAGGKVFEIKSIDFLGRTVGKFRFEEPNWWIIQAGEIADFFLKAQFGEPSFPGDVDYIDYKNYRTRLHLNGNKKGDHRQETDTISRLIYGFSSAFMLTGRDDFLEAAERGCQYLAKHLRFYDTDENIVYWYHGIDIKGEKDEKKHKIFASEFGDDYNAIPMYEQIYALAGLTQTYRASGDPVVLNNIELTMQIFDRFFKDKTGGGYFSHLDPITLDPRSKNLAGNAGKKNWNSVGDHAPAYLINLYLATGEKRYLDFLEDTADCIERYFQDYENSPFVQERFYEDWSHDKTWGWQQDNGVVGHNLKIAWNLMRINNAVPKEKYVNFAEKIAEIMPNVGMDKQRGGLYDVMARTLGEGEEFHRFTWHDRKAWWQQEQGILAYQILFGILRDEGYLKTARETAAFYNANFLDNDDGAVYFNVLNNGIPYLVGNERLKGSHSMSGYHSIELAYLATVYTNLLHTKQPLKLYFKPTLKNFPDGLLRVSPDILPRGSVFISSVLIDGENWTNFDAAGLTVTLPTDLTERPKIEVVISPTT